MLFYLISTGMELTLWSTFKVTKGIYYLVWPSRTKADILSEEVNHLKKELDDLKQDLDLDIVLIPDVIKSKIETEIEMKEMKELKNDFNNY